ncbi:outer membrane porin F precursor [Roseovarius sp. A-2]|uniref:OmpA family protein n=1 Tax=Roseovarius sp. A-2 TaxID=1570360 RepID=UPI0009B54237|nr:OmpA family protein [Roseovarius sp. A-2]GAW36003.1 outer membrane porin F precursor [Roseovarius sp. A-2]
MRVVLATLLIGLTLPVHALDLPLPATSEQTADILREADTIRLPSGPYEDGAMPRLRLEGDVHNRAWRLPNRGLSTLQVLSPLRDALDKSGWEVVFDCAAEECGGFDFRFNTPVLPAPAMFVDLFDYRYLLAERGIGATAEHAMLMISAAGGRGYVQATHVRPADHATALPSDAPDNTAAPPTPLVDTLRAQGHAVLSGLDFGSGAATLGPGPHDSLDALAEAMRVSPEMRIALVGHTDTVGTLDSNIALSQARAEAVRTRLIEDHGVAPERIEAHGIGFLSPRAPNRSEAGRNNNRRVEAVVIAGF